RLAAGPDPGLSQLSDCRRALRKVRLSQDDVRASRQGLRTQRAQDLFDSRGRAEEASAARSYRPGPTRVPRACGSQLCHARTQNAARILESSGLERFGELEIRSSHAKTTGFIENGPGFISNRVRPAPEKAGQGRRW